MTRRRDEDGAGVVLVLGLVAFLVTTALVCGGVVALVVGHRQAQTAADLAALAGAAAVSQGGDVCAVVREIASRNGATAACTTAGPVVTVEATVRMPPVLGGREVRGRARAGPSVSVD